MLQVIFYYIALVLETLVGVFGIRLYEEPQYEVIDRIEDHVEVRRYALRLAAEAELPVAGEAGRNQAFRLLFAYIAGANQSAAGSDRIAMTVPVSIADKVRIAMTVPVETSETSGAVRMRFFLPVKYNSENAPRPLDARVRLVTIPEEVIAVLRFSGSGRDFPARQSKLMTSLADVRWRPTGAPYILYYDAPFTLPFLRRNEAAVAVVETP